MHLLKLKNISKQNKDKLSLEAKHPLLKLENDPYRIAKIQSKILYDKNCSESGCVVYIWGPQSGIETEILIFLILERQKSSSNTTFII